jgi:type IV pilus assembly protein PilC
MATAASAAAKKIKEDIFEWEGKDKNGKLVRGEIRAGGEAMVSASLRRQGILTTKIKKRRMSGGKSIKQKDIAIFTRQLSTMMRAGVPLIQSFDIVARGSTNPAHDPAADRHPFRRGDRHQPVLGLPQAPAAV